MAKFRGRDSQSAEVSGLRGEIEAREGMLRDARAELDRKDREIRELRAEVRRLEIRLSDLRTGGDFRESHGVLWQCSAAGHIEPLAYCPACRLVMTPMPSGYPEYLVCTSCRYRAPFHPEQIPAIMQELAEPPTEPRQP